MSTENESMQEGISREDRIIYVGVRYLSSVTLCIGMN
jgi:hypothetical protein